MLLLCSTHRRARRGDASRPTCCRTTPFAVPATAHDRDLMTLVLLTCVVLLVIVTTILFTFWFSRPVFRRHRR